MTRAQLHADLDALVRQAMEVGKALAGTWNAAQEVEFGRQLGAAQARIELAVFPVGKAPQIGDDLDEDGVSP